MHFKEKCILKMLGHNFNSMILNKDLKCNINTVITIALVV